MKWASCFLFPLLFSACFQKQNKEEEIEWSINTDTVFILEKQLTPTKVLTKTAQYLDSLGLVNLLEKDSTLIVDLMYAKANNFTGEILYKDLTEAYLIPEVAEAVVKAHSLLKEKHPSYSFIIYDAARPMSVQQKMWNVVKGTSKYKYVSNPANGGGLHNYGLAVDISILDENQQPLPMGVPVDHLGFESHITEEAQLVSKGIITEQEKTNRELLREIMVRVGFKPLASEWWHFNWCSRKEAREQYACIE